MYRRFLNKEIVFEEMTQEEFNECINQWKAQCVRTGFLVDEAKEYIKEVLTYHIKYDVDNEYEKQLVSYYLANEV